MKKCVVIIPALNEEKTIGDVIDRIPKVLFDDIKLETVVVNDGSTDDTEKIAGDHGAFVISHSAPGGGWLIFF